MHKLKIAEIFYSLQGEGARAGEPSIFIRLSGCDLACGFCDTEFESGKEFTFAELATYIVKLAPNCRWIIWTGGEPMLQLKTDEGKAMLRNFIEAGYSNAIESNGNHPIPRDLFKWICVSPKVAEHVLDKNFPANESIDELRYVRHAGQPGIPRPMATAKRYFLSPRFNGDKPDPASIDHCFNLCLENPQWALSLQTHKLIKIL
jgi:7-carboxy-7-deazaguanine synthase